MPPGPRSAPEGAVGSCALDALLRDLGPRLRRGELPREPLRFCPTGLPEVDRALGGGFPRGRVGEIVGPASSGRTSLALSLLATASQAGEFAAVVDGCDAFDPPSAEAAGVELSQLLWVRAPERRAWLRSTEQLLEARGFSLVVLDVAGGAPGGFPLSVWPRLARSAASTQTSLVVLGSERVAGTFSALSLELDPGRPLFSGSPLLFEGLQGRLRLVRNRTGPSEGEAPLHLAAPHRAA
ncbi:MAG: hypothetical protein ABFS46_01695 [Myxococcota bacterium]